jgi:hypothetical protein
MRRSIGSNVREHAILLQRRLLVLWRFIDSNEQLAINLTFMGQPSLEQANKFQCDVDKLVRRP